LWNLVLSVIITSHFSGRVCDALVGLLVVSFTFLCCWSIFFAPGALPPFGHDNPLRRPVAFWDWDTPELIDLALEVRSGVLVGQRGLDFRSPSQKVHPNGQAVKVERRLIKAEPVTVVKREPGTSSFGSCEDDAIVIDSSGDEGGTGRDDESGNDSDSSGEFMLKDHAETMRKLKMDADGANSDDDELGRVERAKVMREVAFAATAFAAQADKIEADEKAAKVRNQQSPNNTRQFRQAEGQRLISAYVRKAPSKQRKSKPPAKQPAGRSGLVHEAARILDSRGRGKTREFLVEWRGFSADDSTWEPVANILDKTLIKEYDNAKKKSRTFATKRRRT